MLQLFALSGARVGRARDAADWVKESLVRVKPSPIVSLFGSDESVAAATERALSAAQLTAMDAAAVAALRVLAVKIDTDDELREAYIEAQLDAGVEREKLRPLQLDNVSIPTFLKYCESLGLTPAGRARLEVKREVAGDGKLASLQSEQQRRRPA